MKTLPASRGARQTGFHPIVLAVALLVVATTVAAPSLVAQDRTAVTGHATRFSHAVAVHGDLAVVGSAWEEGWKGAAYVLRNDAGGWVVEGRLAPADLGPNDHFGGSVAIGEDVIVVGAAWQDLFRGAAYVFKRVNGVWTEQEKLTPSDAAVDHRFGETIRISGNVLTVGDGRGGAQRRDAAGAYEFDGSGDGWLERRRVAQPPPEEDVVASDLRDLTELVSAHGEVPPALLFLPPPAPGSVTATDGIFESRVEVRWASVGLDAVIYRILRNGVLISVASSNDSLYVDPSPSVHPGQVYNYCIQTEDMASQLSSLVCDSGSRIIFAPSAVEASDGDFDTHVKVSWTDLSSIEQSYRVRRNGNLIANLPANSAVYQDTSAAVGTQYTYSVAAADADGYLSVEHSNTGWRGPLLPPIDVSASDGEYLDLVILSWTDQAPNETGFRVYRDSVLVDSTASSPGTLGNLSWQDTTIVFGARYTYCVAAVGAAGVESRRVCDEGRTGLATPQSVSASDSTHDDRVAISWEDVSGFEDGYEISRMPLNGVNDGPYPPARDYRGGERFTLQANSFAAFATVLDTTRANATSYDDRTAEAGTPYLYFVRAISNSGGVSDHGFDDGFRSVVLAPYEVRATDGTYEDHVDITWKTNSTTTVLFKVLRDGVFIKSVNAADRLYRDYGGTAGQSYDYTLVAVTGLAAQATGTPDAGKRELLEPTQLLATDEAFEEKTVLSWTENSRFEHGYLVSREDTAFAVIDTIGPNRTSYTDYSGSPGVSYVYRVAAFDSTNGALGYSVSAQDPGLRVLLAPSNVSADKGTSEDHVEIRWRDNSEAEEGFRIYRDAALVGSVEDNAISFVDTAPVSGTHHVYAIRTYDGHGESEAAADSGHTTILAPVSFHASDVYLDRIEMAWVDRSEMEAGFKIYQNGGLIAAPGPDATSYTHGPLFFSQALYETPGAAYNVYYDNNRAYVAAGDQGLLIFDITNPASPSLLGSYDTPGDAWDVVVDGAYAFVADGGVAGGLQIIGISNPAIPTPVGAYDTPEGVRGVDFDPENALVLLAAEDSGLLLIDVSFPASPTLAGAYNTPGYAFDVTEGSGYAYVADLTGGLQIISVLNPASPTLVGNWNGPGLDDARGVALPRGGVDDLVFVAEFNKGLRIIDITNRATPTLISTYDTPGQANNVEMFGDRAFVADGSGGLHVIDTGIPATPTLVGTVATRVAVGMSPLGPNGALVADVTAGLQIISTTPPDGASQYCVRAYNGSQTSEEACDVGLLPGDDDEFESTNLAVKIDPFDDQSPQYFGESVSMSGNVVVVGAPQHTGARGAASVCELTVNGWVRVQNLQASDGGGNHLFGGSVSISQDHILIGAFGHASNRGKAYAFERVGNGWGQTQMLTASDGVAGDGFGIVSVGGDWAIISAAGDDGGRGAAYAFKRVGGTWTQLQKLTASDGAAGDGFGYRVSISEDWAIIGAWNDDGQRGSAYMFRRSADTWTQYQKLTASDGAALQQFGLSVSVSGGRAIIGTADYSVGGSAYVFEWMNGTWVQIQKLTVSHQNPGDVGAFGNSVAINGTRAIIGARFMDASVYNSGAAYIFGREAGTWTEIQRFTANTNSQSFGSSVALDDEYAVAGAAFDSSYQGAVYISDLYPVDVIATDGALESRVRITWKDRSFHENGFDIYRDGGWIASVARNVEAYEDFDAEPGRTHEYSVGLKSSDASVRRGRLSSDFGWRPANGNIAGRITTIAGAGADSIQVEVTPLPEKALLLDGNGGHVSVPDTAGILNFSTANDFTIEAWIKYLGTGGTGAGDGVMIAAASPEGAAPRFPLLLSNQRSTGQPGRLRFSMSDSTTTRSVVSSRNDINDNAWHQVVCVHDAVQDSIRIYIDGVLQGTASSAGLGDITNGEPLSLGGGPAVDSWFNGQLDEIRIWSLARDEADIQTAETKPLAGDEPGLVAYWPIGWPSPYRDGEDTGVMTDLGAGAHYGTFQGGVFWSDDHAPLDVYPITDVHGNFVVNNIYYGTEAEFSLRPYAGNHEFDPPTRRVALTTESPVENQVIFTDISSFTVSGTVLYAGSACGAPDIPILVDGQIGGSTDTKGKFAVAVDLGEHVIRPALEGHSFGPDSVSVLVERDLTLNPAAGVAFNDSTTFALSGRLGGGCGRAVGDITVTIRSENDCLLDTRTYASGDTMYSVALPPQNYLVSASVDPGTIPAGLSRSDVVRYFQNLGVRLAELDSTDVAMDFVYRAPLKVEITGFETYVDPMCTGLTFDSRTLPANLPVIEQVETAADTIVVTVLVYEDYGNGDRCPVDTGNVVIRDELRDRQDAPFDLPISNGVASFTTFAATPNLVIGRTDENGIDRSFQKSIHAVASVEGRPPTPATKWVLVTGRVAEEGADFVTAVTESPLFVLRDPPGDDSYASFEKGHQIRSRFEWENELLDSRLGAHIEVWTGFESDWFVGIGGGSEFEIKGKINTIRTEFLLGRMHFTERSTDITLETRETFSTSTLDNLTGEPGDVFVGVGWNFTFSEVGVLTVEGCSVEKSLSVAFQPDTISTIYTYTEQYIEDVLIPELSRNVEYYTELNDTDSTALFVMWRDRWRKELDDNRSLKANAGDTEDNHSFSGGADFTFFADSLTTTSYTRRTTFVSDQDVSLGGFTFETPLSDIYFSLMGKVQHEYLIGEPVDTTGVTSRAWSYALSDDDINDHFTVDIKRDGRYPTPVFDVRAGASSCPYEPWPDEQGNARMVPRDRPHLSVAPPQRDGVPPDEQAVYTLNLSNLNEDEGRRYKLALLTASNPYGAIVEVGGVALSDGVEYFISAGQTQEATLTVARGPRRYQYDDLTLVLYPACGDELDYDGLDSTGVPAQASLTRFSVSFAAPCSDIALLLPENGWVYNQGHATSGDSIEVLLTDYELGSGDGPVIEAVGAQYRRLGAGREGPGPWTTFFVDADPDSGETFIRWFPPETLEDGVYEIRGYTKCENIDGFVYSEVATGTLERNGPVVFGAPEPADGELSLGEDIGITFNELIDCRAVHPDSLYLNPERISLTYADGPDSGSTISREAVCDERTIIITPTASPDSLEGRRLRASVSGVTDRTGNPMINPVTWTFTYRKSLFTWTELDLIADVPFRNPGSITAVLANGTAGTVDYDVSPLPVWITAAEPSTGTLLPGTSGEITLTIQDDLAPAAYEAEVRAAQTGGGNLVAVMRVHLNVSCHDPAWAIDPGQYEHTMTMVAALDIDDTLSADVNDKVAAFVGNQLRGVAKVMYVGGPVDEHLAFLTVYSNRAQGETVRFQIWDDSQCKLYNATEESHPFVANASVGRADSAVTLTATEIVGGGALAIACNEGWTWISTNRVSADMSLNAVLGDLTPVEGDLVKSQTAFSQAAFLYNDTTGTGWNWEGSLITFDNVSSYMIRLSGSGAILHTGATASINTSIPVNQGWNWVAYLPQGPKDPTDALSNLDVVVNGDIIKSQTGFAQYVGGIWYGGLDSLRAGHGYKLYLSSATAADSSFTYTPYVASMSPPVDLADAKAPATPTVEGTPGWSVNAYAYQFNMTMTAVVRIGGQESIDEGDMVGAFVGGECRGVAHPVYVGGARRYIAFLMIHSNVASSETVEFRVFDADAGIVYDVGETIAWQADAVRGSVRDPQVLNAGSPWSDARPPAVFQLAQNYPNPFSPATTIAYDVPVGGGQVTLRIFDVAGRLVQTLVDAVQTPGAKSVLWNAEDQSGHRVATGVYYYRMTAPGFARTRVMLLLN